MVVDNTGSFVDHHWYRQDKGGLWSHKPGLTQVSRLDGAGNIIRNPIYSNHNYGFINYSDGGILLWAKKR